MSESPIGRLLALTEEPDPESELEKKTFVPPLAHLTPPEFRITSFAELAVGMNLETWVRGAWKPAVVHRIREDGKGPMAVLRTEKGSAFIYAYRWEERDHRRVRFGAGQKLPEPVAPESAKKMRQRGKSMNFGTPNEVPPIDGKTPACIFRDYVAIMREEIRPTQFINGVETPVLTAKQLEVARSMWKARLDLAVYQTKLEESDRQKRDRLVCDDDRWEV